jgi:hypothetical protein
LESRKSALIGPWDDLRVGSTLTFDVSGRRNLIELYCRYAMGDWWEAVFEKMRKDSI